MGEEGRARAAVRRRVEQGRRAAHRVRHWSGTLRGRLVIAGGVLAMLLLFFFAMIGLPHVFRGPTVRSFAGEVGTGAAALAAAAEAATGVPLRPAGGIDVMTDGDAFFSRLWADLRAATRSIAIVQYYWSAGAVLDTTTRILAERARAGVAIHVVYDAFGASDLPAGSFDTLRAAGVRLAEFRPVRWFSLDRATHRTHVRAVVIDGRVGYTGGFGFDDKWLGDGASPAHWRETSVRFTGSTVHQLHAAFIAHWAEVAGVLLTGPVPGPGAAGASVAPGDSATVSLAGVIHSPAGIGSSRAERLLALSVAVAKRRLWISNAYFVPDDDFVLMLTGAAERGVDVRVLTNGEGTDVKTMWYAGRDRYQTLLEGGVRIYEYRPTVMHAKTLLADDAWVEIGTINIDNRSLAYNDEIAFLAIDARLGARMDSLFRADAGRSREITLEAFGRRPALQRLLEWASSLFAAVL